MLRAPAVAGTGQLASIRAISFPVRVIHIREPTRVSSARPARARPQSAPAPTMASWPARSMSWPCSQTGSGTPSSMAT